MQDTVKSALDQIEKKRYAVGLGEKGIGTERIRKYGWLNLTYKFIGDKVG